MDLETTQTATTAKFPILKQSEYDMWTLRIEQYFQVQDYALWDVIENGNSFKPAAQTTTNADGTSTTLIPGPVTTKEKVQKKNDVKARSMLLMALPNKHLMTFNQYKVCSKEFVCCGIQTRLGVMKATRRLRKTILTNVENFSVPSTGGHLNLFLTGFRRFQVVVVSNAINMRHFARECRGPRNQDSRNKNQDRSKRIVNVEETSSKAMVAIDGAGFDWSYMADDKVPTNMPLMAFQTLSKSVSEDIYNEVRESPDAPLVEKLMLDDKLEKKIVFPTVAKIEFVRPKQQEKPIRKPVKVIQKKEDQGYVDNRCSRHMTGNMSYLLDLKEFDGGYVTFGGGAKGGKITYVSQMCDKKNSVFFTDTACFVLSPDFKLADESHVLLKVSRKNNMYSVDMKNIVPKEILTCLVIKATLDESMLWHMRLGHVNFKTINKLCKRTPQQNKVAERKNRTLIEAARSMLADSKLPTTFWAEAVNTDCYVQNRVLVIKPHNKTPYELFLGRKPALSFMRPFRCPVTILNTLDHLGKFDRKADEGFFVGYSVNSKAFRVFNSRTRIVDENLHITFLKNKPNVVESRPEWLFDIDTLTKSMNYKPVIAGNQSNGSAGTKACDNACKARVETVPSKDYILLPFLTQDLLFSSSLKDSPDAGFKPSGEEEKKDAEAPENEDSKVLNTEEPRVNQENDENVNSTNNINTVSSTVDTASIEDNAIDENIVYGCADDLNMPNLEEIDYSNDDEGVDAEADMNNLDTFMPMDVKSAFLYSKIEEEVYVCQPPEFEDLEFPDRVYKVEKALYGLHQAPRACDILLVQVYVDDIIFGSTKKELCTEFEKLMHKKFQMSSMGELTFFLGLQVTQKDDGIFISQDKYVDEILKKFGFSTVKTANTPIETSKPLLKDENAKDVNVHLYRSMIGSLMYLTSLRPDIMFAVCACARFQVTPKFSHLHAMKRIFRYLKGQPKLGLWYPKDSPFVLEAYTDSDYAGASLDRKSTIGGCQFLGRRLISWQCKKQTVVANSTTEAEYVAASNCCGHVLWIQNQLLVYRYNFMNTKIFIDKESTICIVKNLVFHSKTKHIEIRHYFIRDSNEKKLIQMIKIDTDLNITDLLTKAFDVSRFQYLIASIGMLNL
ncbi:putative ribonuclease H-like domain-containing protein [Tanacetum coccineum]